MSAPFLNPKDVARANAIALEIGQTFRTARLAAGDRLVDVATRLGMSPTCSDNIIKFEQGAVTDVKLGTIVRNLALYGYTITVVPIKRER